MARGRAGARRRPGGARALCLAPGVPSPAPGGPRLIAIGLCDTAGGALRLHEALGGRPDLDLILLVCRRSWLFEARVLGPRRLLAAVRLFLRSRLRITRRALDDPLVLAWLRSRSPDVGLHAMGVIYRKPVIDCFRLGILNPHIGLLPRYRGRSVVEWSILEERPTGISVFFVDEGIDTGPRIVLRREIPVDRFSDARSAKAYLFGLDTALFAEALELLARPGFEPLPNDGAGRRYYVMSRLFSGVVDAILAARQHQMESRHVPVPAVDISRTSP